MPVDERGIRVDALRRADVDARRRSRQRTSTRPASCSPATAAPSCWPGCASATRIAIDDDYDAEYRYDRAAVGALQGLDPERIVYAGSASKTLTPGIRLGWLVRPAGAARAGPPGEAASPTGGPTCIQQHAFADFLARGELDRHLRRMRAAYRARRDALVEALAEELPDATVRGIAAGLHATVALRPDDDEDAIVAAIRARRIAIDTMAEHWTGPRTGPPMLLLGYGQVREASIRPGVRAIAEAVREVRAGVFTTS